MCKHGDVFSLQILIGRSLFLLFISVNRHLSSLFCLKVFKEKWVLPLDKMDLICYNLIIANAPLAQLVEQLTLNQWVLGSSPRWCTTKYLARSCGVFFIAVFRGGNARAEGQALKGEVLRSAA